MRRRPTRPNLFRSLKRFGVFHSDWKYILVPTAAAYFFPFAFGLWFYYIPLGFPLGLLIFIVLLAGFNALRAAKPECWLKHRLDAGLDSWTSFRPPIGSEFEPAEWVTNTEGGN